MGQTQLRQTSARRSTGGQQGSRAPAEGRSAAREDVCPPQARVGKKRLLQLRHVPKEIEHEDEQLPSNVAAGFNITGQTPISRVFEPRTVGDTKEWLWRRGKLVRQAT